MSFNTSNIQADTFTGVVSVSAPKHVVGSVELTQDGDNLSVVGVSCQIVNTVDVVSSTSVTTPLITSPELFPITVENLQKVELTSGAGTEGQVLALDASSNLVWADNFSSPQSLSSVLSVGNSAAGNNITDLLKIVPVSGEGVSGQVLSCNVDGELLWTTPPAITTPNISEVLTAGGFADGQSLTGLADLSTASVDFVDGSASWTVSANSATNNLDVVSHNGGYLHLGTTTAITTGQIMASVLIGKKPTFDYWVSPNGSDIDAVSNGGTLENPFATIGACLNYCESLTAIDNQYRYIHLMGGIYSESITITKKVYLLGEPVTSQSVSVGCCLNGSITVNLDSNSGDMFNNGVFISGLLIDGQIANVSTANQMLVLEGVYIYSPDNSSGRALYHNPTSTDSRLKLWNCQIISGGSSGTDPLFEIAKTSQVSMNYVYFSAKGNQITLLLSDTATCDSINNCKFENSNDAGLTAQPIVKITANVSGTYTFTNCAFVYSSSADKSANPNASGIQIQNTSGNNTLITLYNTFILNGTSRTNNYAIQDFNHSTYLQMICLYYMCGALPNTAFAIHGNNNINKFQMEIIS